MSERYPHVNVYRGGVALNEGSLELMFRKLMAPARARLNPTRLVVTQGRIVRVGAFTWYWLCPGRRVWLKQGPYLTEKAARRDCAGLPTAPGWVTWESLRRAVTVLDGIAP